MPSTVAVHSLPPAASPDALRGAQAVIIDLLRASTTICAALRAGAACVRPALEPEEAIALRRTRPPGACILGGERGGVLIPGFDLGNSPREYTPERVRGLEVIFTTTNGTRAIHAAAAGGADRIVIGCFANLSRAVGALRDDGRHVHILCAGTNGEVSMEDVLCAGAIVAGLRDSGFAHNSDDQSRIAERLYRSAASEPDGVTRAMLESRGGRNLVRIGLGDDVRDCAAIDGIPVLPVFDAAAGAIRPAP